MLCFRVACKREGVGRQEILNGNFCRMDFVVADAEGVDGGDGAEARDLEDVVEGRLGVGVAEGVVRGSSGVPGGGKGRW